MAGIGDIADGLGRGLEQIQARTEELLFEPVIRLGVTGLSRAGKTVFITSLVANLLNPGRMPQLRAAADGRLMLAFLQPQPNDAVARFAYEDHIAALTGPQPHWPESTRTISQLRLSLRVRPTGFLTGLTGPRTVHLDIVDYPGEWLLDLPLLAQSYAEWSEKALTQAEAPGRIALARDWLAAARETDGTAALDEVAAQGLARGFTAYLHAARAAGFSGCAPGRFLLPGELEGSPALTFAPLPAPSRRARDGSLYAAFERRFESYKRVVVKPFFRDHFAAIERQIVLVDALGAIHAGPRAVEDLRLAMADILQAFRPGPNSWLSRILGRRIERIAFAATKADHLHHGQHDALSGIMEALVADARARATYKGAQTRSFAIAALRATVEAEVRQGGDLVPCVRGTLAETGREAALFAGRLPDDPASLMVPARQGAERWLDADFAVMGFAPPKLNLRPGEGPPHIRMDRVAEFLIGDRLL
ncbi:YcjX family protein [Halovulum dunhuangense]|uniref:YcjX family protein n=1 Tax=Halovulum dunhuangense TaxID=1505036 RepID=A0A849L632_9RHOB|nr:YcjX family protein [Halovulum dunhuangense]NNU81571.1 YcjX family protein [Halovulum dunhuangense]